MIANLHVFETDDGEDTVAIRLDTARDELIVTTTSGGEIAHIAVTDALHMSGRLYQVAQQARRLEEGTSNV